MPIVNTGIYYIVYRKYGPTIFITQHAFFSALRVLMAGISDLRFL